MAFTIHEVVLAQRSIGNQSPTLASCSSMSRDERDARRRYRRLTPTDATLQEYTVTEETLALMSPTRSPKIEVQTLESALGFVGNVSAKLDLQSEDGLAAQKFHKEMWLKMDPICCATLLSV